MANTSSTSGRIQLDNNINVKEYERVIQSNWSRQKIEDTGIKGKLNSSPLSQLFFSNENINALQIGLKNMVYKKSENKYVIGNQSVDELVIIMRSIFNDNARHLPFKILDQIKELNRLVLNYCVPRIISEIELHNSYLKDIQKGPTFFDRPQATSVIGTRSGQFSGF